MLKTIKLLTFIVTIICTGLVIYNLLTKEVKQIEQRFVLKSNKPIFEMEVDRDYSYRMREAVEKGEAIVKVGLPKRIWLYSINPNKRKKKCVMENYNKGFLYGNLFEQ